MAIATRSLGDCYVSPILDKEQFHNRLFTASLFTRAKEKACEISMKYAGVKVGFGSGPHSLPG